MASADDAYLSSVDLWPLNWAPVNWAPCNGQLLPIQQNPALFSLLGTTYGGNGTTNFALPDLRGRVPVGMGQSPGTSNYVLGQSGGAENASFTLSVNQMPAHTHAATASLTPNASTGSGRGGSTSPDPSGKFPLKLADTEKAIYGLPADLKMGSSDVVVTIGQTGGTQPAQVSAMQPYLVLNYIIALMGIYPQRP